MALQKQILSLPFAKGVDTKTDPAQIAAGKLALIENGVYSTPLSVRKRYGTLPRGTAVLGTASLATFKDELNHVAGDQRLRTFIPEQNLYTNNKGQVPCFDAKVANIFSGSQVISGTQIAFADHSSGLRVMVWTNSADATLSYAVLDSSTNAQIIYNLLDGVPSTQPKALVFGNFLVIIYNQRGGGDQLVLRSINISSPTGLSAAVPLVTSLGTSNFAFDAVVVSGNIVLSYRDPASGHLAFKVINSSFAVPTTTVTTEAATACSIWTDPAFNIWSLYSTGSGTKALVYNTALSGQIVSPTAIGVDAAFVTGIYDTSISASRLLYTPSGAPLSLIRSAKLTLAGAVSGADTVVIRSLRLYSRPFIEPSTNSICFMAMYQSAQQSAYFLIRAFDGNNLIAQTIGKFMGGGSLSFSSRDKNLAEVTISASAPYSFLFGISQVTSEVISPSGNAENVNVSILSADTFPPIPAVEQANNLHFGGGFVSMYDGTAVVEHGFHLFPEGVTAVYSISAGGLSIGSYQYIAIYEWIDSQGNTHKSAPSIAVTVSVPADTASVDVTIPMLRVTSKNDPRRPVLIAVYRTVANGTLFFRVSANTGGSALLNDPTTDSIVFHDTAADGDILGNSQLYTTGGEVDNGDPGAVFALTTYKNRLIAIPGENRLTFWYSKEVVPNLPVEFSPFFVQNIDPRGGAATSCLAMDDKLIIFKESLIFAVTGDGPAPSGAGNDLTAGQIIASDTGCISTPSTVLMPDGIMYQSAKGIELLDRALGTHYVGADVDGYTKTATVLAAVLIANVSQVRFFLDSGICLVYDYFVKDERGIGQWSAFTNTSALSACLYKGAVTYAGASGQTLQEDPSVFDDNGTFYAIKSVTPWLSFGGLQGFQRVYKAEVLGTWESAHNLLVSVAYDFDETIVQTETIPAASLQTPYQWRLLFNRQKCEAIKITIQDSQSAPYGEGLRLSALALEIGVKGGLQRAPQTKTYG